MCDSDEIQIIHIANKHILSWQLLIDNATQEKSKLVK